MIDTRDSSTITFLLCISLWNIPAAHNTRTRRRTSCLYLSGLSQFWSSFPGALTMTHSPKKLQKREEPLARRVLFSSDDTHFDSPCILHSDGATRARRKRHDLVSNTYSINLHRKLRVLQTHPFNNQHFLHEVTAVVRVEKKLFRIW